MVRCSCLTSYQGAQLLPTGQYPQCTPSLVADVPDYLLQYPHRTPVVQLQNTSLYVQDAICMYIVGNIMGTQALCDLFTPQAIKVQRAGSKPTQLPLILLTKAKSAQQDTHARTKSSRQNYQRQPETRHLPIGVQHCIDSCLRQQRQPPARLATC